MCVGVCVYIYIYIYKRDIEREVAPTYDKIYANHVQLTNTVLKKGRQSSIEISKIIVTVNIINF